MVSVQPKPSGRWPVAPKTQASGLGAAAGSAVAIIVVGLIQTYITHKTLPLADVGAIYTLSTSAVAWAAAYLAPHQDRQQPAPKAAQLRTAQNVTVTHPLSEAEVAEVRQELADRLKLPATDRPVGGITP